MAEQIGHMRGPVDAVHDFSCKQAFLRREGIDGRDRTRNTQRHAPGADMTLYGYWRSTTSYRVRIALALKGIACKQLSVNLVTGEQVAEGYARLNPAAGVPALVLDDGQVLTQSMAILEWLDETYPSPPLLPSDPLDRARVRAAALGIATDVHPVNNLRVVGRLRSMGHGQGEAVAWMNDWMTRGFTAFSQLIRPDTPFCFGDRPGLADLCLIPQLYNAHRWGCDLAPFGRLTGIETRCLALEAFATARPEAQPDAIPESAPT